MTELKFAPSPDSGPALDPLAIPDIQSASDSGNEQNQSAAKQANLALLGEFLQQSAPSDEKPMLLAQAQPAGDQSASGEPSAQDGPGQPARPTDRKPGSFADQITGPQEKSDSIVINGTRVKIRSADHAADRSRVVVIDEDYGVHPAGTKITFYDPVTFPQGKSSKYGNLLAMAQHPGGNLVFTKRDGNTVYELAKAIKTDYPGGSFESKFFEELPNGTQLWRTTDGTMVERHSKGSLTTSNGNIARIDFKNGKLSYLTEDSRTFTVEEQGGKLRVTEGGKVTQVDSLTESFKPPYNHPFYGPVMSRTRAPGLIKLDLGNRGECTIYNNPQKFDDRRNVQSVISDTKSGTTQYFLTDGSVVHRRSADAAVNPRDWVNIESKPRGEQTIIYKNGDFITKKPDGSRIEGYKDGHATSLSEKVVEVHRLKDKTTYVLADGGKVELSLRGNSPLVKTKADGTPQIMKDDSIKEHFPHGQPTAYGAVSTLETKTNGETTYSLAEPKDYSKITILGAPSHGYKGFVTMPDGTFRLVTTTGMALLGESLDEKGLRERLAGKMPPAPNPYFFDPFKPGMQRKN